MKTAKCKAFTIVELVIVIGVLAILAAVLIPTFSNLIRRANVAKDEQLVRNLNTAIAVESLTGNVRLTAFSAFDAAERCGYDKENIASSASGNVILWDSVNNVFCYYESTADEYVYVPEDGAHTPPSSIKAYQYWKFYSSDEPIPDSQTYSVCLADGYTLDVPASFNVGVDAGNNAGIDVNYVGSTAPQTVYIRTNGGTL
ncbi:MAG: type II secretion system protein, partial [Clostridia bacterium]|nr:type II secretion system protein [Clostridia bacterium]